MKEDFLTRYDRMARLNDLSTPLVDDTPSMSMVVPLIGGCILGLLIMFVAQSCNREPMPAVTKVSAVECAGCHNKMAHYLRAQKVVSPEKMADALLKTRNPRLLAAIHVGGEKKTPHTKMNTGWKGQYSGAWQTHKRWGKINKNSTLTEQALAGELAIETHTAEQKDIVRGLNAYGGESDLKGGQYAFNVLHALTEVPK